MNQPTPIRWLGRVAGLLIGVLLLEYLLLPQFVGMGATMRLLGSINVFALGLALALEASSLLAYSFLTRTMLPAGRRLPLWTVVRMDVTTLGFGHVAPVSGISANALRYRLLTDAGVRGPDALFVTVVQGVGSAIVLNMLLWLALLVALPRYWSHPLVGIALLLGVVLFTCAGLVLYAFTQGKSWTVRLVRAIAARIPRVTPDGAELRFRGAAAHLRAVAGDRRLLATAIGWAAANWLLDAASLWVFLAALGATADVDRLFIAYGLANVLGALPVTPGGLGVIEGVLVPTLVGAGVPANVAVLGVLGWRLLNFWLPIPAAGLSYLSLRAGHALDNRTPKEPETGTEAPVRPPGASPPEASRASFHCGQ